MITLRWLCAIWALFGAAGLAEVARVSPGAFGVLFGVMAVGCLIVCILLATAKEVKS